MISPYWAAIGFGLGGVVGAAAVQHRQLDDPGSEYRTDCTTYSLSYPLWRVYDPIWIQVNRSSEGTLGDFWFTAHNMATNNQVECEIKNTNLFSDGPWHSCKDNSTQFRVSLKTEEFQIKQSWVCDNSPNITFIGDKKTSLPVKLGCLDDADERGNVTMCFLANVNIEPSLISPIAIDVVVPEPPYELYYWAETCAERSKYPVWLVEDLHYDHTSPQLDTISPGRNYGLTFNLTNLSNLERIVCSVLVDETSLDRTLRERWTDCAVAESSTAKDIISTTVMFNQEYNLLAINQTWQCPHGSLSGIQDTFNSVGYLESKIVCDSSPSQEAATTHRSPSSFSCSMPATNLTGYTDYVPRLPHTSYTRSCTINSFNVSSLILRHFEVESKTQQVADDAPIGTYLSAMIYNSGPGEEYTIQKMPVQDDGVWHKCIAGANSLPWQLVSCEYLLKGANEVGFRFQWYCDDRDPSHAVLFTATAGGQLNRHATNVDLGVSELSWETTVGPMDRGPPLPWI